MENKNKNLLETDAVGTGADVVAYTGGSELVDADDTANRAFNNNMVLANQTNSAAVLNFEKCSGITLGTVINVGWSPGSSALVPAAGNATVKEDESAYKKTPTIKTMMETEKAISTAFLDNVSGNFGTRWREVAVLLEINPLFVDRMYEDYYNKDGTKEVVFQILSKYFKDHEDQATIGWLTSFLWKNGFKKTVWTVKEHYKEILKLEKEFD